MGYPKEQSIIDINRYIMENGSDFRNWYVGIAADPRARLFNDHKVQEHSAPWIFHKAQSSLIARGIEDYFINVKNTQGGGGGGDDRIPVRVRLQDQAAHSTIAESHI